MKKLLIICLCWPMLGWSQLTFTGGPLQVQGECLALWTSGDSALMGFNEGLYRTTNGGQQWELLSQGIAADVDPRTIEYSGGVLIVGTNDDSRIYRSTDFGNSFSGGTGQITSIAIPTASTSGPNLSMMGGTNFDPHHFDFSSDDWVTSNNGGITHGMRYMGGDTVWICSGGIANGTTSYSHDNGLTWTAVATEPQTDVGGGIVITTKAQDFLKVGSRILVASDLNGFPVLYTDDYGATWQAGDLGSQAYSDYGTRFLKVNDQHILTVNVQGIWKSTDQGETWTQIQTLGSIRTMKLWKTDHLLVGTDNGVYEFANYGEGALVMQHGVPASASNLLAGSNNQVLAGTANGVYSYSPSAGTWSLVNDTTTNGQSLGALRLAQIGDSLYAFGAQGYAVSGNGGQTFEARSTSAFGIQNVSTIAEVDGQQFAASWHHTGGSPQQPGIYRSTNNGQSYTQATFSNTVSYGLGGLGGNFVEQFLEADQALVADMQAGYAISTDGGSTWTFTGSTWELSRMAVKGSNIYSYSNDLLFGTSSLEVTTDGGATWTAVSLNGLPNASINNVSGVWTLDGSICTYNSNESPRGIYQLDEGTNTWNLISGTSTGLPTESAPTSLFYNDGEYYVSWESLGTWSSASGFIGVAEAVQATESWNVYPNPFTHSVVFDHHFEQPTQIVVLDAMGRIVAQEVVLGQQPQLNLSQLPAGMYFVRDEQGSVVRLMKR